MARTPKKPQDLADPALDDPKIEGALTELRRTGETAQALAAQLGYPGALTIDALEDRIRIGQRRTIEAVMELGASLMLLREITPHGEFEDRCSAFGIDPRMARRLMSATLKFSNRVSKPVLEAAGSQTKLLELVVLDEDEIEALGKGESVRGVQLDDIETMSVRELRAALREANAEADATKKVLAEKNAKLDAERAKLKRIKAATPDQVLKEMVSEAGLIKHEIWAALRAKLLPACEALRDHGAEHGVDTTLQMANLVGEVQAELNAIRAQFSLPDLSDGVSQTLAGEVAQWAGNAAH